MTHLEEMLRGDRPRAVLREPAVPSRATIERLAAEYGWLIREVSLDGVTEKRPFIEAWAAALDFPAWHGNNWDAFEELLGDLSWLPESNGVIAIVTGVVNHSAGDVQTGMEVVEETVANRRADQVALIVAW